MGKITCKNGKNIVDFKNVQGNRKHIDSNNSCRNADARLNWTYNFLSLLPKALLQDFGLHSQRLRAPRF
jgi:hypothetical protein